MTSWSTRYAIALPLITLALGACGDNTIEPTPDAALLQRSTASASQQASVTLVQNAVDTLTSPYGSIVTWGSSDTTIATVSLRTGIVTGVRPGQVWIGSGRRILQTRDTVLVTVTPGTVVSIAVTIPSPSTSIGQTQIATSTSFDAQGKVVLAAPVAWTSSAPSVASVTSSGLITASAAGTSTVTASVGSVSSGAAVTVTTSTGLVTPPALPRVFLNTPYIPATGKSIYVSAGGSLQSAINSAQRGDEIVLQAGATFSGTFSLPAKPGSAANGWIVIRSDKLSQLPPEGTRVTKAQASLMPKIVTLDYQPALFTLASASGWRVVGVEFSVSAAFTGQQYGIVNLGDGGSKQTSLSTVPTDLVLDRVYVHGQPNTEMKRCVGMNSARTVITDSYIVECHGRTGDSQAIQGFNGPGPYKIVNNTVQGAGENIMWGGTDPNIPGLIPSDIEIRRNYIYTPASWKGVWLRKNLYESKSSQRVLIEGNVFSGSWLDGQQGYAMILKSANQSGACTWCTTSDYTIRSNMVVNVGAGFDIAGREGTSPYPVGAMASRVAITNNILDSVSVGIYQGDSRMVQVIVDSHDVSVTNNTMTTKGNLGTFVYFDTYPSATRFSFDNNLVSKGQYGMSATGRGEGTVALAAVSGGWTFNANWVIGVFRAGYPAGTQFIAAAGNAPAGPGAVTSVVQQLTAGVIIP